MSRIRTIKPEFWRHEDLSALPESTHMLAAALLNYADDEGFFRANPLLIKAECSPLREPSVSIQTSLNSLLEIGFLTLWKGSDGKSYGEIVKFKEHQVVNRPTPSKIKELWTVLEQSVNTHGGLTEASVAERKGREREKEKEKEEEEGSEPKGSGAAAPAGLSPEAEAYRLGKQVLGPSGGGLVTKLREHFGGDWLSVTDILRQAAGKGDPKAWIAGVLRGTEAGRPAPHKLFPEEIYRGVQNLG